MKGYLFQYSMHGIRHELFVPGIGVIWPGLGRMIINSVYMKRMQRVVDKIKKGEEATFYRFLGEKEVPKYLIEEFVGWIKSRELSEEGIREIGNKLEKHVGVPEVWGD